MTYINRHTVLSFLAHPDDAEILCGGTLIRLQELGWDVHIATATHGDCGSATLPAGEIAAIRRAEGVAAAELIGATYHCLEERDVNVIFDKAVNRKVIDLFREISPSLVFTHPRHDYMLDHEQVHLLARSASFSFPIPNASALPLIQDSAIPWLYYCDPLEGRDPYSGQLVEPTAYVDVTSVMERKTEMLACHASQLEWLRSHHGIDEYIEAMKRHDALRGQQHGTLYAEAFIQHRGHAYPASDILHELLGGQ
jgi:LmbE family N-acetylglucosaminyl deacetylase